MTSAIIPSGPGVRAARARRFGFEGICDGVQRTHGVTIGLANLAFRSGVGKSIELKAFLGACVV